MKTIYVDGQMPEGTPSVATIGFFDGVHDGHCYLIKQVKDKAASLGLSSMVVTFAEHPRKVLQSEYQPQMLSTLEEKLELLSSTGIDRCAVLRFDKSMASMSAKDFMQQILCHQLNVKCLVIGYDHRFGHNRAEGFDEYVEYGKQLGMDVVKSRALTVEGENVSSSLIRHFLQQGDVVKAGQNLGYTYTITGRVVSGFHIGRKLGFPTANIDPLGVEKMIPAAGVYAVTVKVQGATKVHYGMMNIGMRPTFQGDRLSLEVHILDMEEDLYGKNLSIGFVRRIRAERKFGSQEELVAQLHKDKENVIKLFI